VERILASAINDACVVRVRRWRSISSPRGARRNGSKRPQLSQVKRMLEGARCCLAVAHRMARGGFE
jgi:hypothetical protein